MRLLTSVVSMTRPVYAQSIPSEPHTYIYGLNGYPDGLFLSEKLSTIQAADMLLFYGHLLDILITSKLSLSLSPSPHQRADVPINVRAVQNHPWSSLAKVPKWKKANHPDFMDGVHQQTRQGDRPRRCLMPQSPKGERFACCRRTRSGNSPVERQDSNR